MMYQQITDTLHEAGVLTERERVALYKDATYDSPIKVYAVTVLQRGAEWIATWDDVTEPTVITDSVEGKHLLVLLLTWAAARDVFRVR